MTLERNAGQIADIAMMLGLDVHRIKHLLYIAAALGIRAFPYPVSIHRLTLGRRDLFLITAIGNPITIRIQAYPVRIDRAAFRRIWLQVKLIGGTVYTSASSSTGFGNFLCRGALMISL